MRGTGADRLVVVWIWTSSSEESRDGSHGIVELPAGVTSDPAEDAAELRRDQASSPFSELHDDTAAAGHELAAVCGHRGE
jgi:hypothetical protein